MTKKKRPFKTQFNMVKEDLPKFQFTEPSVVEEKQDIPFRVMVEQAERSMLPSYENVGDQFPDFYLSEFNKLDKVGKAQYIIDAVNRANVAKKEMRSIAGRIKAAQAENVRKQQEAEKVQKEKE